jgi:thiol-disulfide isomerase/thioredoxin/uncharacterized membrane protein YphA (DoxX/SURF4 family)
MDLVVFSLQWIVAAILGVAAVGKWLDRPGTVSSLQEFGLSFRIANVGQFALPALELGTAILLVIAPVARIGALLATVLFAAFIVAIARQLREGRAPDCHCFGQLHSEPAGTSTIVRNLALITASVVILGWGGVAITDLPNWQRASFVLGLGVFSVAAVLLRYVSGFQREQARLADRIQKLEGLVDSLSASRWGEDTSVLAPSFDLETMDGAQLSLNSLIATGRPTVLLFVSPGCAPCSAIVPDAEQWQQRFSNTINFAFISSLDREANIEKFGKVPVPVALQADREVAVSYGAEATPTGILIDRDGRIRARPAVGQTAIRELVSRTISSELDAGPEGQLAAPAMPAEEESIAALLAAPGSNQVGTYGSRMPLPVLEGGYLALDEVTGQSPILLFWNTDCTFCQGIVDDIREWEAEAGDEAGRLLIYAQGSEAGLRNQGFTSRIVLDPGFTIAHSFGATGTPSAALLDEANRLAQPVAIGGDSVLDLLFDQIEPLPESIEETPQPVTSSND